MWYNLSFAFLAELASISARLEEIAVLYEEKQAEIAASIIQVVCKWLTLPLLCCILLQQRSYHFGVAEYMDPCVSDASAIITDLDLFSALAHVFAKSTHPFMRPTVLFFSH